MAKAVPSKKVPSAKQKSNTNKNKKGSRLSRLTTVRRPRLFMLIVFIVVFMGVGIAFLWRTYAATFTLDVYQTYITGPSANAVWHHYGTSYTPCKISAVMRYRNDSYFYLEDVGPNTWHFRGGPQNQSWAEATFSFGDPGDIGVCGDWNGDGYPSIGVYRPSTGMWYLTDNNNQTVHWAFQYGNNGDIPLVGDWDGNGYMDIGVHRPSTAQFHLNTLKISWRGDYVWTNRNDGPMRQFTFGNAWDYGVAGDFDRNGKASVGVVRGTTWFLTDDNLNVRSASPIFNFGNPGDVPIVGDFNGDGYDNNGVVRRR